MSLLNQLRARIGLDRSDGQQAKQQAAKVARRTGERVRNADTERARRATRQASESIAVDPPGQVRRRRGTSREQDVAERAERAASMRGPVEASLEPADSMGIDQLASTNRGSPTDGSVGEQHESSEPTPADLAVNIGGGGEQDEGDEWGWL